MPSQDASAKTPYRPEEPCENQETPDLRSVVGPGPTNSSAPDTGGTAASGEAGEIVDSSNAIIDQLTGDRPRDQGRREDEAARERPQQERQELLPGVRGLMGTAIKKHARDFAAIAALLVAGLLVSYVIVQEQRLRIPILEERPFELKAEFETAQAVVPGQGQTIRVAGVQVGDVDDVELVDGKAVVTFGLDRDYLPVYKDATILLRPTTGLKDMFFQLDPGTRSAGEVEEGGTIPLANTAPDVNLDEILDALDTDTQAYLRLLISGAGKGLDGRGEDLGKVLGWLGPINRDFRALNSEVAKRKENLRRLITNFNQLTLAVGQADDDLARLVSSSATALGAIAEQDPSVRRGDRAAAGHARAVEDRAHQRRLVRRTSSARRSTSCGRSRATSTRSTPRPRSSPTRSRARSRTRSGRSCARRASRSRT